MRRAGHRQGRRGDAREPGDPKDAGEIVTDLERSTSKDWIWLIALCALGIVLGRLQNQARLGGASDPVSLFVKSLVEPAAAPVSAGSQATGDFFSTLGRSGALAAENRRLRQLAAVAETYTETIDSLNHEIDSLRALLDVEAIGKSRIGGRVIGYFPLENRLTISVGTTSGVRPGLPVIAGEGLIGTVQTADARSSQVRLLSSPRPYQIGATVRRDPPSTGLMHGEAVNRLILEFTDIESPVAVGDLVVTSGHSELIPEGIPIGRVVQVYVDEEFGTRIAQVFPAVALGKVREVVVLR